MRIIKRTKITVIRTETVYLSGQEIKTANDFLPLQKEITEENKQGTVIEIEAIDDADEREEGENK